MNAVIKKRGGVVLGMMLMMLIGLTGCHFGDDERDTSPTGSAVELGNYAQQSGQSRVVTVNGETHQINGVVSGSVVAGGLYIEINEQSSVGSPAGTDQVAVNLADVTITFTGLPSGVSGITVSSGSADIGQYAVSGGSAAIALTTAQWAQWFGPTHYAVVCEAVGSGSLTNSMASVAGRLPSGALVVFGTGTGTTTTVTTTTGTTGTTTVDPNELPTFVDNGDGTVTDTRTGLIWLQHASCNGQAIRADQNTWANTLASGSCGLTDGSKAGQWRLPTVMELQDLIDYSQSSPALPAGHPFTNVQNEYYWTSTDYAPAPVNAWHVDLDIGKMNASSKSGLFYGWAVR